MGYSEYSRWAYNISIGPHLGDRRDVRVGAAVVDQHDLHRVVLWLVSTPSGEYSEYPEPRTAQGVRLASATVLGVLTRGTHSEYPDHCRGA